jgi:hypothetical protein
MKYSKLTNKFAKTFLNIMDRHNYGVWYPNTPNPAFEHPTNFLEKIINYDFKWTSQYQFTKKELEKHFADGLPRFYYTTRRNSDIALLQLDIDAHDGQTDAASVIHWLERTYFTGCYYEPSPSNTGFHGYIKVNCKYVPRKAFNALIDNVSFVLHNNAKNEGFKAIVDNIRGTCAITEIKTDFDTGKNRRIVISRGQFAKIPTFPFQIGSLNRFLDAPLFSVDDLKGIVIKHLNNTGIILKKGDHETKNPNSRIFTTHSCLHVDSSPSYIADLKNNPDAFKRMRTVAIELEHSLKRPPQPDEIIFKYEEEGLNTGDDVNGRRSKRAQQMSRWLFNTIDWQKIDKGFCLEDYSFMTRYATDELIETLRKEKAFSYQRRITLEDLAVAQYVVRKESFTTKSDRNSKRQFTFGIKSIMDMFSTLHSNRAITRRCSDGKAVALRIILEQAGLIVCVDRNYVVGGPKRGIGRKFVIGPNDPRFQEFEKTVGSIDKLIAKHADVEESVQIC